MFRQALASFAQLRFPGHTENLRASRWTVSRGDVPNGFDALVLLTVEEMAVNELREPFHHWVTTLRIPVSDGRIGSLLPYLPPALDRRDTSTPDRDDIRNARDLWDSVSYDLSALINGHGERITATFTTLLKDAKFRALSEQSEVFSNRIREVERAMAETTLARLEKEKAGLLEDLGRGFLFEFMARETEDRLANLDEELNRRRTHYEDLVKHLKKEQHRVLNELLPRRYTLKDVARVFPVSVEIRLPMGGKR